MLIWRGTRSPLGLEEDAEPIGLTLVWLKREDAPRFDTLARKLTPFSSDD